MADRSRIIAAIDIGSNKISMTISEILPGGKVIFIEDVKKVSSIGKDTFNDGRISAETINETCDILKRFSILMRDYGAEEHYAVATSGLREAENSEYVIDQIMIKTGIKVKIINNSQERFFSFLALKNNITGKKSLSNKSVMVVNISSGGVEVSIQKNGKLIFTEYLKLGSLRLRETLSGLEAMTSDYPKVMEEFIESKLSLLKPKLQSMKIKKFIGLGGEISTISGIIDDEISTTEEGLTYVKLSTLAELYKKLKTMSTNQISDMYDLSRSSAEILLPSVIMFYLFIKMTKADEILAPLASHRHGIIYDLAGKTTDKRWTADSNIVSAAWKIARKYGVEKKHASFVVKTALAIFDQTLEISRLDKENRLYLQLAAILHDVGNYVGFTNHEKQSYTIVKMQNLLGISDDELNIIANVTYYHTSNIPNKQHGNYINLSGRDKIRVSKLAAILKFAEALDCSHTQKIQKLSIAAENGVLVMSITAAKDILLEKWSVEENIDYFEEVMGVRPQIKIIR